MEIVEQDNCPIFCFKMVFDKVSVVSSTQPEPFQITLALIPASTSINPPPPPTPQKRVGKNVKLGNYSKMAICYFCAFSRQPLTPISLLPPSIQ